MTARGRRGAALLVGALLGLAFTLVAAVQVAGWTVGAVERTSRQVIPGPVAKLTIDAGAGEITILPSQDGQVRIDTTSKGSLHAPSMRAVKDGPRVLLRGDCPVFSFGPCQANITVHVPVATTVDVRSSSGDVTAGGVGGPLVLDADSGDVTAIGVTGSAELSTASGDVSLRGGTGTVKLRTRSGDVDAADVASEHVTAGTQSGDVTLNFRVPPRMVDVSTTSGDVNVGLPDSVTYDVAAATGSGDSRIGVRTDPNAARVIRARTTSGDATVGYGDE